MRVSPSVSARDLVVRFGSVTAIDTSSFALPPGGGVAVADDQLYWPYVGEYWRDELGTYQYTLTKGCIDRDAANKAATAAGRRE